MLDKLALVIHHGLSPESRQILQTFQQYIFANLAGAGQIAIDTFRDLLILREKYERLYQQKLELELENRKLKQKIATIQRIANGD